VYVCAGDPLDAVILGNHLPYGYTGKVKVKGVMKFIDAGLVDDKLICTQLIPGMRNHSCLVLDIV
jgi:inorganic pyrophosphatase